MILHTIQHEDVYNMLMETGYYAVSEDHVDVDSMGAAYSWLTGKMKEKIGFHPPPNVKFPVWAWYRFMGKLSTELDVEELLSMVGRDTPKPIRSGKLCKTSLVQAAVAELRIPCL